jgi:GAF domain-containing protein/HAMP domain-containing protein
VNTPNPDLTLQSIVWIISLIELITGLYILVLNSRHVANRYLCFLLLALAINGLATGLMMEARSPAEAFIPALILAILIPAIQPIVFLSVIAVLKPQWFQSKKQWLWTIVGLFALAPMILTFLDIGRGTNYWFSGIKTAYSGGFIWIDRFANGALAPTLLAISFGFFPISALLLIYFSVFDRRATRKNRLLSGILLIAVVLSGLLFLSTAFIAQPVIALVLLDLTLAITFTYVGFSQMLLERRLQRGSLRSRLLAIILIIAIPVFLAMATYMSRRAETLLKQDARQQLSYSNESLSAFISLWLDANVRALQQLASLPDITSMDATKQKPILETTAKIYPQIDFISTVDINGFNIARSDDKPTEYYGDLDWFQQAIKGNSVTYQTLIDKTTGQPALVVSTPIRDQNQEIVGVAMFATDLDTIFSQVQMRRPRENSLFIIVDDQNQAVAHPEHFITARLTDLSQYPPVSALRSAPGNQRNKKASLTFFDSKGEEWYAFASTLDNGWIVIAQIPARELLARTVIFQRVAWLTLGMGSLLLLVLSGLTIQQALHPIATLTETARSIASGDLTRVAVVESEDELGVLARAFNAMTAQLRELITTLEKRVAERTRELEKRAVQLQVTAEVASQAAAIRDLDSLLEHAVRLISDRFNFYHAGIFLIDDAGKYAVLRAASSEGGKRMLSRGHRLAVGKVGIVGYVAEKGEPRIALDVGTDAVFFNNPDLPQTRSEMALPLKAHGRIIGVLDVQSTKEAAFTNEDVEILQILADQIALAIDNARLHGDTQEALRQLSELYRQQVAKGWQKHLEHQTIAYAYKQGNLERLKSPVHLTTDENGHLLQLPIQLRGQTLGFFTLRRDAEQPQFSADEIELAKMAITQVALALENARLLEENLQRAQHESLISEITAKAQSSLDVETVMKTAVTEIARALGIAKVQIRLGNGEPSPQE